MMYCWGLRMLMYPKVVEVITALYLGGPNENRVHNMCVCVLVSAGLVSAFYN